MGRTLILTDDIVRAERLARSLGGGPSWILHDLYGEAEPPSGASLIISDVRALTSDAVLRLRRALAVARAGAIPFLALIHGSPGRGEIQAVALGATRTLPASATTAMLLTAVAALGVRVDGGRFSGLRPSSGPTRPEIHPRTGCRPGNSW